MPTLAETRTLLSRYSGANNDFEDRLNLVRARLLPMMNASGTKEEVTLPVFSDKDGYSIVTAPYGYANILKGRINRSWNPLCNQPPRRVTDALSESGMSTDFQEVTGKFCVFQEWSSAMRLQFAFETSEASGVIHIRGKLAGEQVYSLYSSTWIEGEKLAFSGTTTITSTKYFDPEGLSIVKPVTLGRVFMFVIDDAGNRTAVGEFFPSETIPRRKRYRIESCSDASTVTSATPIASQYYTKAETDALFAGAGTITVNAVGTHDLVYGAYFLRILKVVAAGGVAAYTHKFTLDNATVKDGGTLRVLLEIPSVADGLKQTVSFYDNTIAGTLLQTVVGDSSNAIYQTLVFSYTSGVWSFEGREL